MGDPPITAALVLSALNMAAEGSRAAALDRGHDLELAEAHVPGIGLTPCRPEVAEDIRDFESGTDHECRLMSAARTFCLSAASDDRAGSLPRGSRWLPPADKAA